jgi:hypothetical protein
MMKKFLSGVKVLPVHPAWYQKWLERWKQHLPEMEKAMHDAAKRAEAGRSLPLL